MKSIKKLVCVALAVSMVSAFAACSSKSEKTKSIEAVSAEDLAKALEDAGFERLDWDHYYGDPMTFYVSDEGDKVSGWGEREENVYTLTVFDNDDDAKDYYEENIGYFDDVDYEAMGMDVDKDKVSEDDYAYYIMTYDGDYISYFWAGNSVLNVDGPNVDESNAVLSAIGYPEF